MEHRPLSESEQAARARAGIALEAEARDILSGHGMSEPEATELISRLREQGRLAGECALTRRAHADERVGRGAICRCGAGRLGLVLSVEPFAISYPDGTSAVAWTGVHLSTGLPWSSSKPVYVADGAALLVQIESALRHALQGFDA
jgi:hypothetical protein